MNYSRVFAYVSNAESREISVLQLDGTGQISLIETVSVPGKVMPMAVSPDRRFLYAALRTEPYSVASFAIDGLSGRLTHLANAPLASSTMYLRTDRTGRFLFATSVIVETGYESRMSVHPIGPHGVALAPQQIVRSEPKTHSIQADPSNRFVLTMGCKGDLILRHAFDAATGVISYNSLSPVRVKPNAGPRHFAFHPNNRFLYLLNETDGSVYAFGYDVSTAALNELQIVSALPPDFKEHTSRGEISAHAADIHLTPDGRFLYASVRPAHTLAAFKIDLSTGMLTPAGHFATEKQPRGFNIDPFGKYLLAVGELSHSMTSHAIDGETGKLTKVMELPLGKDPNWVEIIRL